MSASSGFPGYIWLIYALQVYTLGMCNSQGFCFSFPPKGSISSRLILGLSRCNQTVVLLHQAKLLCECIYIFEYYSAGSIYKPKMLLQ